MGNSNKHCVDSSRCLLAYPKNIENGKKYNLLSYIHGFFTEPYIPIDGYAFSHPATKIINNLVKNNYIIIALIGCLQPNFLDVNHNDMAKDQLRCFNYLKTKTN